MRRAAFPLACLLAALLLAALPAAAQDDPDHFPQSPKIGPPRALPEPGCDTSRADGGDWLLGRWVGPQTKLSFGRSGPAITWVLDRASAAGEFGWAPGGTIDGKVASASACSVHLVAGPDDAFVFDGVLTEEGRLYGNAVNKAGANVRFVLRREK